jgi:hypothetical protein
MEHLQQLMRPEDYQGLITMTIMPKISEGVAAWNPREDTVPVHAWIHPWLPLLGKTLSTVFPEIRRKLQQALSEWDPSDASAHIILQPWAPVFEPKAMEQLLLRSIMPKLVTALRQLVIAPHNQDLQPFHWVLLWRDLIPPFHFNALLEGEFFPKWMQVLHAWLNAPNADFAEVSARSSAHAQRQDRAARCRKGRTGDRTEMSPNDGGWCAAGGGLVRGVEGAHAGRDRGGSTHRRAVQPGPAHDERAHVFGTAARGRTTTGSPRAGAGPELKDRGPLLSLHMSGDRGGDDFFL